MTRTAIVSLDYDSCSDILFTEVAPYNPEQFDLAKQTLLSKLDKIAKEHDIVEIYVGSNRQDISVDTKYAEEHENGSCFKNLEKLCKERGWIFRRLLLADTHNNLPAGTAMENKIVRTDWSRVEEPKLEIVKGQINDVLNYHPDEVVDFYFFDDDTDDKYMKSIQNHYNDKLPKHINNLSLVRYDWYEAANNNRPSLMNEINITQPKITQTVVNKPKALKTKNTERLTFGLTNAKDARKNKNVLSLYAQSKPLFFPGVDNLKRERSEVLVETTVKRVKSS